VRGEGAAVDVVQARAGHQALGYVIDGDCVGGQWLVAALVGDFDHSGDIDVEGEVFGLCAVLCRRDRAKFDGYTLVHSKINYLSAVLAEIFRHIIKTL
jgi:hypothetical protein